MKKWIGEEGMKMTGLTMQLWKEIAIAINQKYLKKRFQQDEEDEERVNEDEVENMQINHESHVTGMIYTHGIRKQNKTVALIRKKYQQASKNWH